MNAHQSKRDLTDQQSRTEHMVTAKVDQTTQIVAKLKSESENIGTVLDVIQGIAEQTNLLVLNAAIEAPRSAISLAV